MFPPTPTYEKLEEPKFSGDARASRPKTSLQPIRFKARAATAQLRLAHANRSA
jgi:hypothetical protein